VGGFGISTAEPSGRTTGELVGYFYLDKNALCTARPNATEAVFIGSA
jgi:hypothetical protein